MTDVKIGLETHVQLDTSTKLFCGCPNEEAEEPNTHVCETCLGHPGSKPRLNQKVLEYATKTARALQYDVNEDVFFSRKTYFYPDMSKNYQITQYEVPVGEDGEIEVKTGDEKKDIGLTRLHIEEDPAKLKHAGGSISNAKYTLVDYNRAGTPLLEIVTDPDFESPKEARAYLQQLVQILEYLGIYSSESEFSIKSDANISIEGGARVEVKNITGTKAIEKALSYEISRQKQLTRRGREVEQETRSFNQGTGATEALRMKETEEDYGYIFDPDLTRQALAGIESRVGKEIPELPHEKFERFRSEYGLEDKLIESLIADPEMADDFEALADEHEPELVASWMTGELRKTLNYHDVTYSEINYEEARDKHFLKNVVEEAVENLEKGDVSDRAAEEFIQQQVENALQDEVEEVEVKDDGSRVIKVELSEELKLEEDIEPIVHDVIEENPDAVEDYHSGEEGAINFLVGQVMQKSSGKADPKTAREKILERL